MIAFIQELREYITNVTEVINEAKEEIIRLSKENAELKKKNLDAQDAVTMQMYTNKVNKEIANRQLTKAVLIIKNLLHLWEDVVTEDTVKAMIYEAKRFLREADKWKGNALTVLTGVLTRKMQTVMHGVS